MHRRNHSDITAYNVVLREELNPASSTENIRIDPNQSYRAQRFSTDDESRNRFSDFDVITDPRLQLDRKSRKREQKLFYKEKKKQADIEVRQIFLNQDTTITSGWLRLRNTTKNWVKLFAVAKPGLLILFRNSRILKQHNWAGTVMLNSCQIIERPSKKDGFCFKLFHPLGLNFWAKKGPRGENISNIKSVALPLSYLIIRTDDIPSGNGWIDALNCARMSNNFSWSNQDDSWTEKNRQFSFPTIRISEHSSLISGESDQPTSSVEIRDQVDGAISQSGVYVKVDESSSNPNDDSLLSVEDGKKDDDNNDKSKDEKKEEGMKGDTLSGTLVANELAHSSSSSEFSHISHDSSSSGENNEEESESFAATSYEQEKFPILNSPYHNNDGSSFVDDGKTEIERTEGSLLRGILGQLRSGADLSQISLPATFFEPQSLLQKFAGYFYHADLLQDVIKENEPLKRMLNFVKFYLSGFYNKPKGVKKPFNPILGEIHRCCWQHKDSRTFFVAESVSHHPPVFCFHGRNRKIGFTATGTVPSGTKFYGNSLAAVFGGDIELTFLDRNEMYKIELPYVHIGGILIGKMTLEYAGKANIVCLKTGYSAEINFLTKPMFGFKTTQPDCIEGKIKFGNKTVATLEGSMTGKVFYKTEQNGSQRNILIEINEKTWNERLPCLVPKEADLLENESLKVWSEAGRALRAGDFQQADVEKMKVEEKQRAIARQRAETGTVFTPALFDRVATDGYLFKYKFADSRPWDSSNDILEYEKNGGEIRTKSKIHATSFTSKTAVAQKKASVTQVPTFVNKSTTSFSGSSSSDSRTDLTKQRNLRTPQKKISLQRDPEDALKVLESSIRELKCEMKVFNETLRGHTLTQTTSSPSIFSFSSVILVFVIAAFFQLIISYFSNK